MEGVMSIKIRSARPGVSEPVKCPIWSACAPIRVAMVSAVAAGRRLDHS